MPKTTSKHWRTTGYLLITGDLFNGHTFHGPFSSEGDLHAYAKDWRIQSYDWTSLKVRVQTHQP